MTDIGKFFIVMGGIAIAGVGGYLIYKKVKSKNTLPTGTNSGTSSGSTGTNSSTGTSTTYTTVTAFPVKMYSKGTPVANLQNVMNKLLKLRPDYKKTTISEDGMFGANTAALADFLLNSSTLSGGQVTVSDYNFLKEVVDNGGYV